MATICVCNSNSVHAQVATNLISVTIGNVESLSTTIDCTFSPATPIYRIANSAPNAYLVTFTGTVLKRGLAVPAGNNFVTDINVVSQGTDILVTIKTVPNVGLLMRRNGQSLSLVFDTSHAVNQKIARPTSVATVDVGPRSFRVIRLKYADVSEIAGILGPENAIIAPTDQFSPATVFSGAQSSGYQNMQGSYSTTLQGAGGLSLIGQDQQHAPYGQRVDPSIAIDRRLNAVILSGPDEIVARNAAIVEALDVPSRSVTLEAQIVELTDTGARNVGIIIGNGTAAAQASLTVQTGAVEQAGFTLQAQVLAQIARGEGKLLARPRIQTTSGTAASILTGDSIPVLTTLTIPGTPPVIQQQIQYVNVGVHLQILPRVSLDGDVSSHIVAEVSSVTGYTQGNIPQVSQRQAVANATVHDGNDYVIGGLIQDNELRSLTKIPFLGDIPLLGALFRSSQVTHQRTNLYIIITPHVASR